MAVFIVLLAVAAAGALYWFKGGFGGGDAQPAAPDAPSTVRPPQEVTPAPPAPRPRTERSGGGELSGTIFEMPSDGSSPPRQQDARPDLPAARPSVDLAALENAARRADDAFKEASERAAEKLKRSRRFASRQAKVEALEQALQQARATGTPQQKLDASSAWNKARLALEKDLEKAVLKDAAVARADAARKRAAKALADAQGK